MIRIAHVTDLHLVEPTHTRRRNAGERARLRYLNVGRQIDSAARHAQAVEALRHASLAEHVVVTGGDGAVWIYRRRLAAGDAVRRAKVRGLACLAGERGV